MRIAETLSLTREPPDLTGDGFGIEWDEDALEDSIWWLKTFHMLPFAGGWMNQPSAWVDSVKTRMLLEARLRWENAPDNQTDYDMPAVRPFG